MTDALGEREGPVRALLEDARRLGFLGPGPVEAHVEHALGFASALTFDQPAGWEPELAGDLGTGGGVPGLVLALRFSTASWVLLEVNRRRAEFLRRAIAALQLGPQVVVIEDRAEVAGHDLMWRGRMDAVTARGFGPPATTAECGAPFLRVGGRMVVSEPPGGSPERWPADGLAQLGLSAGRPLAAAGSAYRTFVQDRLCGSRFPRRTGVPAKRPLF